MVRGGRLVLITLACATASVGLATEAVAPDNFAAENQSDVTLPTLSEEGRIFTGEDIRPLTPTDRSFSHRVESAIADAKSFASFMGPETWAMLIGGFALIGLAIRSSERVLHFDPDARARRKGRPETPMAASDPDASTPPRSGSARAPSVPPDPVE